MTKSEIHTNVTWTDLFFLLMLIIKVVATMIVVLMYIREEIQVQMRNNDRQPRNVFIVSDQLLVMVI